MHYIENEILKVSAKKRGAELCSIIYKPSATQHLWQADPSFWGWHAPVLFPVVGRCLNDAIEINGRQYHMEKHGFARKSEFELEDASDTAMRFMLSDSPETRALYPFSFRFEIEYRLESNSLKTTYRVTNTGDEILPFCIGGHPALAVPFHTGEKFSDYYLLFEKNETEDRHHINSDGFFDGRRSPVFESGSRISLREALFEDDALIFKQLNSRELTIASHLHTRQLTVNFSTFQYLGIWTKPGASYVCIEPWLGCADTAAQPTDFYHKEGVQLLGVGKISEATFTIRIR